jgi:hypothetical protein
MADGVHSTRRDFLRAVPAAAAFIAAPALAGIASPEPTDREVMQALAVLDRRCGGHEWCLSVAWAGNSRFAIGDSRGRGPMEGNWRFPDLPKVPLGRHALAPMIEGELERRRLPWSHWSVTAMTPAGGVCNLLHSMGHGIVNYPV